MMNILALLSLGLLSGNELSIGAFVNPSLSRLNAREQAAGSQAMARTLGRVMPFWMAATLLLLGLAAFQNSKNKRLWGGSALLMAFVVAWSATLPLPINNRVARWELDLLPSNWRTELQTFSLYHNIRVIALLTSFLLALRGATSNG
jgi:hypothetical protein